MITLDSKTVAHLAKRLAPELAAHLATLPRPGVGEADAEATRIYGNAYGADPEFYTFSKTLESYRAVGDNTTLMIKANSDFFRYLESTTQP